MSVRHLSAFTVLLASMALASAASARNLLPRNVIQGPGQDEGTYLMAELAADEVQCQDADSGTVELSTTLITSGSVDSAQVMLSVDDGDAVQIGIIQPQDFAHDGRIKTADFAGEVSLSNGTHTLTLCFVQSGDKGRAPKRVCGSVEVTVACAPKPICEEEAAFFGNVPNNPRMCTGRGTPHIPVHLRGAQYEDVVLEIDGPDGFGLSMPMRHAGKSCVHHALWDTRNGNHGGPGEYTFSAYVDDELIATIERPVHCD